MAPNATSSNSMPFSQGQPLVGQNVIICRAAADAAPLISRLTGLGANVISVPLIEPIAPPDGGEAIRTSVLEFANYDWMVTTSANGSRSILEAMQNAGVESTPKLACVGSVTAKVFADAGFVVSLQASVSSAAGLVAQFPDAPTDGQKRRVLAPLACLASDQLETGLRAKGYDVDRVDAYDTAPTVVDRNKRDDISAATSILFTSSSTVDRFVTIVGSGRVPPIAISIGPKTTETMIRRNIRPTIEATNHNQEGVIEALCHVVSTMDR